MCFFISLIPATLLLVLGFFVLYAGKKSGGKLEKCGQLLAAWVFLVTLVPPAIGVYVTANNVCPVTHILDHIGKWQAE